MKASWFVGAMNILERQLGNQLADYMACPVPAGWDANEKKPMGDFIYAIAICTDGSVALYEYYPGHTAWSCNTDFEGESIADKKAKALNWIRGWITDIRPDLLGSVVKAPVLQ